MILPILLVHLVTAQVTVVVTQRERATIQDSVPAEGATVQVTRDLAPSEKADEYGEATLKVRRSRLRDSDEIRASKKGYRGESVFWEEASDEDPIRLMLTKEPPSKICTYTVYKPVYETRVDGTTVCHAVAEKKSYDCSKPGPLLQPQTPPPHGYQYVFAYVVVRWDVQRQMWAYRPHWNIAQICPQARPWLPCACQ